MLIYADRKRATCLSCYQRWEARRAKNLVNHALHAHQLIVALSLPDLQRGAFLRFDVSAIALVSTRWDLDVLLQVNGEQQTDDLAG